MHSNAVFLATSCAVCRVNQHIMSRQPKNCRETQRMRFVQKRWENKDQQQEEGCPLPAV